MRKRLMRLGEPLQQGPQLCLACLPRSHLSAQQSHDCRYARSGRYFGTPIVSRRFHEALLSSFQRSSLIFGRKPADDFRYLWYRVNRHPKKGFLVFGLCHGKLVGHPIAQLRVVRTVYDAERYCRCGDDKILYPSNFGSGDFGRPKGALDGLGLFFVVDGTRSTFFSREQQARILRVVVAGLARFIAGSVRLNSASTRQPGALSAAEQTARQLLRHWSCANWV